MKKIIMLAAIAMMSTNAMAGPMYDSKSLTCSSIHEKIASEGSIVLKYPSSNPAALTYNRYVSNSMSCLGQGAITSSSVPTSDNQSCKVKTCSFVTGKGPNKNH
ncbi:hypothetical protein HB780_00100 (plasmid) [Rhizobium lusitanum]|uniref:hypothetical protein n=1 Tax=Rhizobium lusitanum TaxID=293958 RepID=UPI001620C222|nr:hypothetical protein [Rhizobium lusitanum]QND44272.1 hypothetical protein HB780_00100 [Rhizobium lusitanum]